MMSRSGAPGDGPTTTVRDALQDPKHLVKGTVYEAGGHRVLTQNMMWTAMRSSAWKAAESLVKKDPPPLVLQA